jgi:hypothetical protein
MIYNFKDKLDLFHKLSCLVELEIKSFLKKTFQTTIQNQQSIAQINMAICKTQTTWTQKGDCWTQAKACAEARGHGGAAAALSMRMRTAAVTKGRGSALQTSKSMCRGTWAWWRSGCFKHADAHSCGDQRTGQRFADEQKHVPRHVGMVAQRLL